LYPQYYLTKCPMEIICKDRKTYLDPLNPEDKNIYIKPEDEKYEPISDTELKKLLEEAGL